MVLAVLFAGLAFGQGIVAPPAVPNKVKDKADVEMSKNGAVVRVYSMNKLVNTFRIPADGKGPKWNVFRIEKGAVVPVNTVTAK
jgi:hypothetical protein